MSSFHITKPADPESLVGVAIEEALIAHEREHGWFVDDLRDKAVHAALDVLFGERCEGCGERGPFHGIGVCV